METIQVVIDAKLLQASDRAVAAPDKECPVLILTRDSGIRYLPTVTVATFRGVPLRSTAG
jgi:hypothetical protein